MNQLNIWGKKVVFDKMGIKEIIIIVLLVISLALTCYVSYDIMTEKDNIVKEVIVKETNCTDTNTEDDDEDDDTVIYMPCNYYKVLRSIPAAGATMQKAYKGTKTYTKGETLDTGLEYEIIEIVLFSDNTYWKEINNSITITGEIGTYTIKDGKLILEALFKHGSDADLLPVESKTKLTTDVISGNTIIDSTITLTEIETSKAELVFKAMNSKDYKGVTYYEE